MKWYLPMTIIPGIGLIILSTTNSMLALNNEISQLNNQENKKIEIIKLKLLQLKKLSISIVFQYIGVLLFLMSGVVKSIFFCSDNIPKLFLIVGVVFVISSVFFLLVYSIKSVIIRQKHLKQ
tara:strand:+ start:70 stop:435 length:366 start_codon:yes stop_codon:yes gene_type:complete